MTKLHSFSHRGKCHALIIAKKNGEIPQIPMSLNWQNPWKEIKVCGQNVKVYMIMGTHILQ
jgi:hypothetical protein